MPNVTVDRRLFLTADKGRLVDPDDPAAAFLWATPGQEVTKEEAARVGYQPAGAAPAAPAAEPEPEVVAEHAAEPAAEKAEAVDEHAEKAEAEHADTPKRRGRSTSTKG